MSFEIHQILFFFFLSPKEEKEKSFFLLFSRSGGTFEIDKIFFFFFFPFEKEKKEVFSSFYSLEWGALLRFIEYSSSSSFLLKKKKKIFSYLWRGRGISILRNILLLLFPSGTRKKIFPYFYSLEGGLTRFIKYSSSSYFVLKKKKKIFCYHYSMEGRGVF